MTGKMKFREVKNEARPVDGKDLRQGEYFETRGGAFVVTWDGCEYRSIAMNGSCLLYTSPSPRD